MLVAGLLVIFFAAGIWAQRFARSPDRLRDQAWGLSFFWLGPMIAFYSFSVIEVDGELGLAVAAATLSSWVVLGISYGYGVLAGRDREERGALTLAGGFSNTGTLGYPLGVILFGQPGLALMVLYSQLAWLVPTAAVSTTIARRHGRMSGSHLRMKQSLLLNPPFFAAVAAVVLRWQGVHSAEMVEAFGKIAAEVVGPLGVFQLGISLPLGRISHGVDELGRTLGVCAIRFAVAPLVLLLAGLALGTDIPRPFYLAAAMPCAFHLLVLARVFELRPRLMRLMVVGSSIPAVAVVLAIAVVFG